MRQVTCRLCEWNCDFHSANEIAIPSSAEWPAESRFPFRGRHNHNRPRKYNFHSADGIAVRG
ncbi:hypothetical protein ZOSMA_15G00040 [Zostera marina]|uniref:Uncharacterized protein n=1 Tax=Zostera marina TaxID=29655 RepID=A0A0K9PUG7_ZOSMR|nr:hypothetical protein ZOSMA_15G00040 [Zostera marina]